MGSGCFHLQRNQLGVENTTFINNTKTSNVSEKEQKIILIQSHFRGYLEKKKLANRIKLLSTKIIKKLDNKRLYNQEIITNSKTEKYYQELLESKTIKLYSEYINQNPNIKSKLEIIKKFTVNIPHYVVNASNEAYKGSWNMNKKYDGYGVIYKFDNMTQKERRIEGIFSNGILNGYGRIIISNEELLRGDFALNKLNGLGEYFRKDGSVYRGAFYEGKPQGNGSEKFKDGSSFEGYYIQGKKKNGKFVWKDKNSYQGYFENDLFHGQGTYKWGDKKMYEGNWKYGKMDGKGKLTFSDGSYYEGNFKEGLKDGTGQYIWTKYNYYKGGWKNDRQNGFGVYFKNGKKIKGIWEDGKFKKEINYAIDSNISRKKYMSSEKISHKNFCDKKRNTYVKNIALISQISGDKKSMGLMGTFNEEDNEINKKGNPRYSIRSSFGSVHSFNSIYNKK